MASISKILGTKRSDLPQRTPYITQLIHYTQFEASKMQFYNCEREVVEQTADNIELAGEIEAPVVVRKIDAERYEILSGHKRVAAVKILVEERGLKKFALIPARIVKVDDEMAEYILISTNDYPKKSDYERMMEVVRLYEIIPIIEGRRSNESVENSEKISSRMLRRLVAREASICETRVGNFTNIYKHFSPMAMEAFKNEEFGIHIAIKLASLSMNDQDKLVKKGSLTIKAVSEYIERMNQLDISISKTTDESSSEVTNSSFIPCKGLLASESCDEDTEMGSDNVGNPISYCNNEDKPPHPVPSSGQNSSKYASQNKTNLKNDAEYDVAIRMKTNAEAALHSGDTDKTIAARIIVDALTLWLEHHYR